MKRTVPALLLYLLISSTFLIPSSLFSQSATAPPVEIKKGNVYNYARKIVDTMASESMHGRGYVNDGNKIAANYIKTEFQKFGLKSFTKDYYQKVYYTINTFPGKMSVTIDGKELVPGKDFIIKPTSSTIDTTLPIINYDESFLQSQKKLDKFVKSVNNKVLFAIDTSEKPNETLNEIIEKNPFGTKGIVVVKKKLTMEMAQRPLDFFGIELAASSNIFSGKKITIHIENNFIPNYPTQNVIGYVEGSEHPDSFIVFSAHYDHLGQMGKDVYFPGANDNASGCAMLLNLAKYYSMPEHKPKCSIAFMAFGGEEVGLLGSKYYTEHPLFPLKNIKFLFNMDIMGTGEEGITVVNGTLFKTEFEKLKQINTENNFIKDVYIRGKAANSDHYLFTESGVKAFFIYTMGGIKAYHDIYDKAETLPLNEFEDLFGLITSFSTYLQN